MTTPLRPPPGLRERLERLRSLEWKDFDPGKHPRDRRGRFTDKPDVRLPGLSAEALRVIRPVEPSDPEPNQRPETEPPVDAEGRPMTLVDWARAHLRGEARRPPRLTDEALDQIRQNLEETAAGLKDKHGRPLPKPILDAKKKAEEAGDEIVGKIEFPENPRDGLIYMEDADFPPETAAWIFSTFERDDWPGGLETRVREDSHVDVYNTHQVRVMGEVFKDGKKVGRFSRRIDLEQKTMENAYLELDSKVQGQGFAEAFYRRTEAAVAREGVETVDVHANIDIGGYAWARRGFTWSAFQPHLSGGTDRERARALAAYFAEPIRNNLRGDEALLARPWGSLQPKTTPEQRDELRAFLGRLEAVDGWETMPSPQEIAALGELQPWTTLTRAGVRIPMWPGKRLLLGREWYGFKPVGVGFETKTGAVDWNRRVMEFLPTAEAVFVPGDAFDPHDGLTSDYNLMGADLLLGPEGETKAFRRTFARVRPFNPHHHPRDNHGKFVDVPDVILPDGSRGVAVGTDRHGKVTVAKPDGDVLAVEPRELEDPGREPTARDRLRTILRYTPADAADRIVAGPLPDPSDQDEVRRQVGVLDEAIIVRGYRDLLPPEVRTDAKIQRWHERAETLRRMAGLTITTQTGVDNPDAAGQTGTVTQVDEVLANRVRVWTRALDESAQGLDLTDPEDRALFRTEFARRAENARVEGLREVADLIGAPASGRSRREVIRALTDHHIATRVQPSGVALEPDSAPIEPGETRKGTIRSLGLKPGDRIQVQSVRGDWHEGILRLNSEGPGIVLNEDGWAGSGSYYIETEGGQQHPNYPDGRRRVDGWIVGSPNKHATVRLAEPAAEPEPDVPLTVQQAVDAAKAEIGNPRALIQRPVTRQEFIDDQTRFLPGFRAQKMKIESLRDEVASLRELLDLGYDAEAEEVLTPERMEIIADRVQQLQSDVVDTEILIERDERAYGRRFDERIKTQGGGDRLWITRDVNAPDTGPVEHIDKALDAVMAAGAAIEAEANRRAIARARAAGAGKDWSAEFNAASADLRQMQKADRNRQYRDRFGVDYQTVHDAIRHTLRRAEDSGDDAKAAEYRERLKKHLDDFWQIEPDAASPEIVAAAAEYEKRLAQTKAAFEEAKKVLGNKRRLLAEERAAVLAEIRPLGGEGPELRVRPPAGSGEPGGYWAGQRIGEGEVPDDLAEELTGAITDAMQLYPRDWNAAASRRPVDVTFISRGHFSAASRTIALSLGGAPPWEGMRVMGRVGMHEYGHLMEDTVAGLKPMEWAFHWRRTTVRDKSGARVRKGKNRITQMPGYDRDEKGSDDEFRNRYSGKVYRDAPDWPWELFTTGVEAMFAGERYADDDEGFAAFVLGTMAVL